jgi:hypothetical protein
MKKALLITGALVALTASQAFAVGGINLSWTDCGLSGQATRTFACNVNTGSDVLVGSFSGVSCGLDSLNGQEAIVDLQFSGAATPAWWAFTGTNCRSTGASVSFDFTSMFTCADYWLGGATGGFVYQIPGPSLLPNTSRLKMVCAIAGAAAGPWNNKLETYSWRATLNHTKTTGTGFCAGCLDGACIVFNSLRMTQNAGANYPGSPTCIAGGGAKVITNPLDRQYVTWQAGIPNCGNTVTPTKNATWGQVKSLYR